MEFCVPLPKRYLTFSSSLEGLENRVRFFIALALWSYEVLDFFFLDQFRFEGAQNRLPRQIINRMAGHLLDFSLENPSVPPQTGNGNATKAAQDRCAVVIEQG